MYTKTITYEDYNGVTRTEDFLFNLTKTELVKLEIGNVGGFTGKLERLVKAKDYVELSKYFDDIIRWSYGVKSDDGKHFIKTDEAYEAFKNSPAYDILYMDLLEANEEDMADFIIGIMPKSLQKDIDTKVRAEIKAQLAEMN